MDYNTACFIKNFSLTIIFSSTSSSSPYIHITWSLSLDANTLKSYLKKTNNTQKIKQNNLSLELLLSYGHHPIPLLPTTTKFHFLVSSLSSLLAIQWASVPITALKWLLSRLSQISILSGPRTNSLPSFYLTSQQTAGSFLKHFSIFPSSFLALRLLQGSALLPSPVFLCSFTRQVHTVPWLQLSF